MTLVTIVALGVGIRLFLCYCFTNKFWFKGIKKNEKVEFWWTVLPALWLGFLSYPSLHNLFMMDCQGKVAAELTMEVVGHQWYWTYNYDDGEYDSYMVARDDLGLGDFRLLEVDKRVVAPMDKVLIRVTRDDVIHSWSIPSISIKIDAVPGKHNVVQFTPMKCGVFYGQCAELCGVNHSYMPIVLEVVSGELFGK